MGTSLLPDLLGLPPLAFAFIVVVLAGAAFVAAEKIEARFAGDADPLPLQARARPKMKLRTAGALAVVVLVGMGTGFLPRAEAGAPPLETMDPLALAQDIIAGDVDLMILDVREGQPTDFIPGAYPASDPELALQYLNAAANDTRVVLVGEQTVGTVPDGWPDRVRYFALEGGFFGWEVQVLTPAPDNSYLLADREWAERQRQISAFFSGAVVESSGGGAPPPLPVAGNRGAKPKAGGC